MEELKRFQGSTFDTIARGKLVEDRDTILELTGEIQELQNEINCINDSRDFQDAESVRSGHSHVTSQPMSFMVDSVDDVKSSCTARGIRMPDFDVLDAKIASALNRIIQNTRFKKKVSLEEQKAPKRGPFPSWKADR